MSKSEIITGLRFEAKRYRAAAKLTKNADLNRRAELLEKAAEILEAWEK